MVKYLDGLDAVAAALGNPGRRQLVDTLARGAATSSQLAAELGIGLPGVLKQLSVLSAADLITSRKTGRVVTHRLRPEPLLRYTDWLAGRTAFWQHQLDALGAAFADTSDNEGPSGNEGPSSKEGRQR